MRFDSLYYLELLIGTWLAFTVLPRPTRPAILLLASLIFYGFWSVEFIGLIVVTAGTDYLAARKIAAIEDPRRRKRWLALSMTSNLLVLGFFKYTHFLLGTLAEFFPGAGRLNAAITITLPVGISFYTFQSMSYVIDVYRGRLAPAKSFRGFFLFVLFFPQLVAGPIERSGHLMPQLEGVVTNDPRRRDFLPGLRLIAWGLFKKLVVADLCALWAAGPFAAPDAASPAALLVAAYAFAIQIYFDFSAYSDIARGSALFLGVRLMKNFKDPYLATSPQDFWRRWHISLSEWIRDYLYVSLGGSRGNALRTAFNLLLTMALAGLWHGAAWTFVIWGVYHGFLLIAQRLLARPLGTLSRALPEGAWNALRVFTTFHLVVIGWIFFRAESTGAAWTILGKIGGAIGSMSFAARPGHIAFFAAAILFWAASAEARRGELWRRIGERSWTTAALFALSALGIVLFAPEIAAPFIYFRF